MKKGTIHMGAPTRTVIAVLTYKRTEDLTALLTELTGQMSLTEQEVDVLVVDNDPSASARQVVEGFARNGLFRYAHEPKPGISAARNRALNEAATYQRLIFIDDDERPGDHWLPRIIAAQEAYGATAVVGPVVSRYAKEPEEWIVAGRFFDRRRLPSGSRVSAAATNNLLLDMEAVRRLRLQFDERYGITGGSDTVFTRQLTKFGETIIWCDDAVVFDMVPMKRLTRDWVLQRAYRSANGWIRVELDLERSRLRRIGLRAKFFCRAIVRLAGGSAGLVVGAVAGRIDLRARGMRTLVRGAGLLMGTAGVVYSEYTRPGS